MSTFTFQSTARTAGPAPPPSLFTFGAAPEIICVDNDEDEIKKLKAELHALRTNNAAMRAELDSTVQERASFVRNARELIRLGDRNDELTATNAALRARIAELERV